MTKYTRREFFRSIVPVSIGIVSFLASNGSGDPLKLDQNDLVHVKANGYNSAKVEYSSGELIILNDTEWSGFISQAIRDRLEIGATSDLYFLRE